MSKQNELLRLKEQFEYRVNQITHETDAKKDIIRQHNEWIVEKSYLEN